jgi:hypothetical protein
VNLLGCELERRDERTRAFDGVVALRAPPCGRAANRHVRFPPDSDQTADIAGGPFRADFVAKVS